MSQSQNITLSQLKSELDQLRSTCHDSEDDLQNTIIMCNQNCNDITEINRKLNVMTEWLMDMDESLFNIEIRA
jgi:hypothetical protein